MDLKVKLKLFALLGTVFTVALLAVFFLGRHSARPPVPVAKPAQPAGVVVTPVAVKAITERQIPLLTKDPADAARIAELVAVNRALNSRIDVLSVSRGESTSTGTLEPVINTVTNTVTQEVPAPFEFRDYRLDVKSDGKTLSYTLKQAFLAITSTGRHKDGSRVVDVALYEVGPGNQRTPIPITTNAVVVDETANHLLTGFNVQGGGMFAGGVKGFVADVQWLKYGRANNPGDLTWAFLSPAVLVASEVKEPGLLPVSINLATHVKHQPFTNIWLSPYIGVDVRSAGYISRIGAAGTFTW